MSKFNQLLDSQQRKVQPIFVSSYIPRKCGIATFTKDLTTAMNGLNPEGLAEIVAIDPGNEDLEYPVEVKGVITKFDLESYDRAAEIINASDAEVLCLQHEYGLYGTIDPDHYVGEYIVRLLRQVDKPIITTLHTILEHPLPAHRAVMAEISELSDIMITMMPNAKERLESVYGINPDRVVIIHHGVADRPRARKVNKKQFGWEDKKILLMSGLMSPGKGIEYVIEALPAIIKDSPEALFVVVGQTHPDVLKKTGEEYRDSLTKKATQLGVVDHLVYVNEYLPLDRLLEYYEACDIYLTPHLDPQQVASGTLAYALGMGKACISTKYIYANEMLKDGRGVLVDFKNASQIAEATTKILTDPGYQNDLERKSYALGRKMSWPRVAERYLNLFRLTLDAQDTVLAELKQAKKQQV